MFYHPKGLRSLFYILCALIVFALPVQSYAKDNDSVYDRVIGNGKIRCGYFSWYPAVIKDSETGQFKGIVYDYMNKIGEALHLEIEWTEEIGLGDYPAALESGRIDAMCSGIWVTAERGRVTDFVDPIYYLPLYAYARTGDTRFDKDIFRLNDPQYKLVILEGGATASIQRQMFPKNKPLELPQLTSPAELFVNLQMKKADAAIYDPFTYQDFNKYNPGKVRQIGDAPLKVFPNVIAVKRGEMEFLHMLNNATTELLLSGEIDRIIDRHETYKGAILRVARPYAVAGK